MLNTDPSPLCRPAELLEGLSDEALMRKVAVQEEDAFNELCSRHRQRLFAFFDFKGAESDAEDLVQEVLWVVFRSSGSFRGDARFSTWLYTIAWRTWCTHLRNDYRRGHLVSLDDDAVPEIAALSGATETNSNSLEELLFDALEMLAPRSRAVIVLRYLEGLPLKDIAEVLLISAETVKVCNSNALRKIRDYMGTYLGAASDVTADPDDQEQTNPRDGDPIKSMTSQKKNNALMDYLTTRQDREATAAKAHRYGIEIERERMQVKKWKDEVKQLIDKAGA